MELTTDVVCVPADHDDVQVSRRLRRQIGQPHDEAEFEVCSLLARI